jgi:hypothetical protein
LRDSVLAVQDITEIPINLLAPHRRATGCEPPGYTLRIGLVLHPTRRRLLLICAISVFWIAAVLLADRGAGIWTQRTLGAFTWLLLLALLRGESRSVR